jgi:hypothetical protein
MRILQVRGPLARTIAQAKASHKYAEGLGPREIGLNTIFDFRKYETKNSALQRGDSGAKTPQQVM